jgi:hypothetical protein
MCELFSIGVITEPAIKFVTDFWDNPRKYPTSNNYLMQYENFISNNSHQPEEKVNSPAFVRQPFNNFIIHIFLIPSRFLNVYTSVKNYS